MAKKITKHAVERLKPGDTIWDSEIRGFGCRKTAKGAASYILKYRFRERQRWLTIGRHGSPWTPVTARKEALKLLGELAGDVDPAATKDNAKARPTLTEFYARYERTYSAKHKKPSSRQCDHYYFKNHLEKRFGRSRLDTITKQEVVKLHSALSDRPYAANRVIALLRHLFTIAEQWGCAPEGGNPCVRIKLYKEEARERFLSQEELGRLTDALAASDAKGGNIYVTNAIRLLILTGARLGEILSLRWEEVDFSAGVLRLADSKTGKKIIPLSAPAINILSSLPRLENNPHVICGHKTGAHLVNIQKPWRRIRKAAGLEDVRIHDLRHTFASVAVQNNVPLQIVGKLLGHSQLQTTARYAHLNDEHLKTAAEHVSGLIIGAPEHRACEDSRTRLSAAKNPSGDGPTTRPGQECR